MSKTIKFKGGWWAEVRTSWSYGADMRIGAAWAFTNDGKGFQDACKLTLDESVINCHLPDTEGNALVRDEAIWDKIDGRIGRKLLNECRTLWSSWQEEADPKDIEPLSPDTQPA